MPAGNLVPVSFSFTIPVGKAKGRQPAAIRKPNVVPSGTTSISIAVNGAKATMFPCTSNPCTGTVLAPAGSDTFLIGALNSSQAALAGVTTTLTVTNNVANTLNVTLLPIPNVTASISNAAPLQGFGPHTYTLLLNMGFDASGNFISPGPLGEPVTLTPTTSDMTLSPSSIATSSGDGVTTVTVSYNGNTLPSPYAIAISNGFANTSVALAPSRYYIVVGTTTDTLVFSDASGFPLVGMFSGVGDGDAVTINNTGTIAYAASATANTIYELNLDSMSQVNSTTFPGGTAGPHGSIGYDRSRNELYAISEGGGPSGLYELTPTLGSPTSLVTTNTLQSVVPVVSAGSACLILGGPNMQLWAYKVGSGSLSTAANIGATFVFAGNPAGTAAYAFEMTGGNVFTYSVNASCSTLTAVTPVLNIGDNAGAVVVNPNGQFIYIGGLLGSFPSTLLPIQPPATTFGTGLSLTMTPTTANDAFGAWIDDAGDRLYVADTSGLIRVFSVSGSSTPSQIATISTSASSGTPASIVVGP